EGLNSVISCAFSRQSGVAQTLIVSACRRLEGAFFRDAKEIRDVVPHHIKLDQHSQKRGMYIGRDCVPLRAREFKEHVLYKASSALKIILCTKIQLYFPLN